MKAPTEKLIEEYKAEFTRTTGKTVVVTFKGPWLYIDHNGYKSTYRRNELPLFITRLKQRPNFIP